MHGVLFNISVGTQRFRRFSGNKINSLENIIAFESNIHKMFGGFRGGANYIIFVSNCIETA